MTAYEDLLKQRDNFITAAIRAEDKEMSAKWVERATEAQIKLNDMNMETVW